MAWIQAIGRSHGRSKKAVHSLAALANRKAERRVLNTPSELPSTFGICLSAALSRSCSSSALVLSRVGSSKWTLATKQASVGTVPSSSATGESKPTAALVAVPMRRTFAWHVRARCQRCNR